MITNYVEIIIPQADNLLPRLQLLNLISVIKEGPILNITRTSMYKS